MANTKERQRRARKAYEKGREARQNQEPLKSNPFALSAHGVGAEWERGWKEADDEEKRCGPR